MGCELSWSDDFKREMREKERKYREKVREALRIYNGMIDKVKVKEQVRADVIQVLKEAMNQEIPDYVLWDRVRYAARKHFDIFEAFNSIVDHQGYEESVACEPHNPQLSIL